MRMIPSSIAEVLTTLLPGDVLVLHRGKEGWARMERIIGEYHPCKKHCLPILWKEVFQKLPDDWVGSITFHFAEAIGAWTYSMRTFPPVDNHRLQELV